MKDPGTIPGRGCEGIDPDELFTTSVAEQRRIAKTVCTGCPALDVCLEWALAFEAGVGHSGRAGIYGGLTPRQRAKVASQRKVAPAPDPLATPAITHGTDTGYKQHRRRKQDACDDCRAAHAAYVKRRAAA
jgi:WhiB family redox-sensing transcriptional regulator